MSFDAQQLEPVIERLKTMGFNTYEAKVYLALLKNHPATGYEISKDSGVPQARAYDTLKALESRKAVVSLGGKPTQYLPVDPQELLSNWERSFQGSIDFLKEALPNLSDETIEPIVNIRGERVLKEAIALIDRAERSVCIEVWSEDATAMSDALFNAKKRGVAVKVVGYRDVNLPGIDVYPHSGSKNVEATFDGRHLILCVDDKEGIVGTLCNMDAKKPPLAVQTRNPGIVLMMKELIVHDIFLLDVERNLHKEMVAIYGKDLKKLRQKILGDDITTVHHFSFCQ